MRSLFRNTIIQYFFFLIPIVCYGQKGTIVSGYFEGASENEMVYIESNKGIKDSSSIKNKQFSFNLNAGEEWDVYFVRCPAISNTFMFPLFLKKNSSIHFHVNKELNQFEISGDGNAEEQNRFYKRQASESNLFRSIKNEIAETKDSVKLIELEQKLKSVEASIEAFNKNWVIQHKHSPFSVAVLRLFVYTGSDEREDTLTQKYFDLLSSTAKDNNFQAYLLKSDFAIFNDKYSNASINTIAPEFILNDTMGNKIRLSDFRSNYLLIDFWASWCTPCRINNPRLKSIFERYKGKGLNVLSISVDTDAEKWKAAIKKDDMDWQQGSDLEGLDTGVAFQYQILAIPHYILLGPDGKVISKNSGEIQLIESRLKEIFK